VPPYRRRHVLGLPRGVKVFFAVPQGAQVAPFFLEKVMATSQAARKEKAKPHARTNVPPVAVRREREATAEQIGQRREARIAFEGPAHIDRDDIEVVPGPVFKDKAETEAFMADKITVLIHNSREEHPVDPVMLSVNGRQIFIWRNQPTIIKRCYLERLCRAKPEGITQDAANPDPKIANKLNISSGLLYPFSVIDDPSPKGHAWMQKILAEV
jgi:hypothetical protein